jgi:AcrR family transcriptional regulator
MTFKRKQRPAARRRAPVPQRRSEIKRARIIETATRYFARHGYEGTRAEDIAKEMGIAKGSIFQHFKTKEGLFFAVFKKAAGQLGKYLSAPEEIRSGGFFDVVRYWLSWPADLSETDAMAQRIFTVGIFGTDLRLKRDINRFIRAEDPFGTLAFVKFGVERGEVREDVDPVMIASMVDWLVDRFQDAMFNEELDPGLFRRQGAGPEKAERRVEQFSQLIHSALARQH